MDETIPTGGTPPARERLPRGTAIGRYVVLQPIGSGGVGEVYAAFDPQLDRKVAIKLVRPEMSDALDVTEARARMQREAQAMARLSHPNVVAVHDVGTFEDDVFVAMELIEGKTLKHWLAETRRPWPEVRDMFVQAARGLAAAHAAGMIHRDFKPENVMIGADGRARVLDFGLARPSLRSDIGSGPRPLADTPVGGVPAFATDITRTGTLLGTPAYMSPEQHLRLDTDARSDQFSFCIALYEGLYGERPFAGDTIAQIGMAALQGKLAEPPKGTSVPAWLRAVVVRGLAPEAAARWPSMDALIAALLADPALRRRRIALIVALPVVVVAAAGAGYKLSRSAPTPSLIGPPAPLNLDLDEGDLGKPPKGWIVAGAEPLFPIELVDQGCLKGRCARMHAEGALGDDDFGNLMQTIDATRYRGKRVRFRVSTRVEGGARPFAWLRVDRPPPHVGYDYNTRYDAPTQTWKQDEIVGQVADDAISINLGVVSYDHGRTYIDGAAFDVVPDTTPITSDPFLHAPTDLDFEAGQPGQPPPGWIAVDHKTGRATISTNAPHTGAHCVEVPGAGEMPVLVERVDGRPYRGKHIRFTAYARGAADMHILDLAVEAGDDSAYVIETGAPSGPANDWQAHTVEMDVPATAEVVQIAVYADSHTTIYVDDITLE